MSHTWSSKRKVRKAHKCWGCCSDILAGSVVEYSVTVDDSFCAAYWCNICEAVMGDLEYYDKQDGFAYGDIKEYYPEAWEEAALEFKESATTASNNSVTQAAETKGAASATL